MASYYGIDLGTTYSCIARVNEKGETEVIKNREGRNITPSVVEFESISNIVVGEVAKGNSVINPENIVQYIKRSIGDKEYYFTHQGEKFTAEQISSFILKKVVNDAMEATQDEIKDVVITVPAYFGFDERQATKNAGIIAGLNVLEIVNEPTAAAIAYGSMKEKQDKIVLIYDLGGGTFDVTVAEVIGDSIQVICTDGDHTLGGKDWDSDLAAYITNQFCKETGMNEDEFYSDSELISDLIIKTEEAKKQLSSKEKAKVALRAGSYKTSIEITKALFDEITRSNLLRTIELTKSVLNQASKKISSKGIPCSKLDEFIFVGGSTRMPQVKEEIIKEFNIQPIIFDPDEAVAKGAAILSQYLSTRSALKGDNGKIGGDFASSDVTSKSYGLEALANADSQELSLSNVIVKNTKIPCSKCNTYYTMDSNQSFIDIQIYESNTVEEWTDLSFGKKIADGEFKLPSGLPISSPIDVTFSIDRNGLLSIRAVERSQKRECTIVVKTEGLTESQITAIAAKTGLTSIE